MITNTGSQANEGEDMTTDNSFEDLPVWKSSRKLSNLVISLTDSSYFRKDRALKSQIRRASISLISNIAEGFEHESQARFCSYLGRAKASAAEIRCQLYIALDQKHISEIQFHEAVYLAGECSKQLYGFIKYLRKLPNASRFRGSFLFFQSEYLS